MSVLVGLCVVVVAAGGWIRAEHAEDVHLSAWLCPCGAQVPALNLAEDVLCDTCEANTQEEL